MNSYKEVTLYRWSGCIYVVGIYIIIQTYAAIIKKIDAMKFRRTKGCLWQGLGLGKLNWKHNIIIL